MITEQRAIEFGQHAFLTYPGRKTPRAFDKNPERYVGALLWDLLGVTDDVIAVVEVDAHDFNVRAITATGRVFALFISHAMVNAAEMTIP
jgi:hypothetical protein